MAGAKRKGSAPGSNGASDRKQPNETSTRGAKSRMPRVDPSRSLRQWEDFGKHSPKAERAKSKSGGAYR